MVGQDGQRAAPGGLAERGELARPDGLLRPVGAHVRVLEQAECEFLAQESTYGFIDAFLRDTARADQFHDHLGALLAPNWSLPASSAFAARSATVRCSAPQPRAGNGSPSTGASVSRPQSVQTMPSKRFPCFLLSLLPSCLARGGFLTGFLLLKEGAV